jgi:1-acyl-sn-glycerol-3-phosphate acyltransferase
MSDLLAKWWYRMNYWAQGAALTLGFSLRTEGMRHVPRTGPALLVANHQSFLDPSLVGVAARRRLCYLARKSLFRHRLLGWLIRSLNAVPVDQEGVGIEGLRVLLQKLREGHAVLVFPEGHRTRDGAMRPLLPGIHLLVKRAPAPIIPIGIAGSYEAWPHGRPLPLPAPLFLPAGPGTLAVAIGRPLDGRRLAELPREQVLKELFEALTRMHAQAERLRRK